MENTIETNRSPMKPIETYRKPIETYSHLHQTCEIPYEHLEKPTRTCIKPAKFHMIIVTNLGN